MSNESLPRNVKKTKMANNNDFDQRVMIDVVQLLRVWFRLHNVSYFINTSKQEIWEIHHLYPGEGHEESNMVSIQPGESASTSEIFDDHPHQWNIPVLQKFKGEKPLHLVSILRLDVRLIVMLINVLSLVQFLTNIRNSSGL